MIIPGKMRNHIRLEKLDKQRNSFGEVSINWIIILDKTWAEISDPQTVRHEDIETAADLTRNFIIKIRNRDVLRNQDLLVDLRITVLDGAHKNINLEVESMTETSEEIEFSGVDTGRN